MGLVSSVEERSFVIKKGYGKGTKAALRGGFDFQCIGLDAIRLRICCGSRAATQSRGVFQARNKARFICSAIKGPSSGYRLSTTVLPCRMADAFGCMTDGFDEIAAISFGKSDTNRTPSGTAPRAAVVAAACPDAAVA